MFNKLLIIKLKLKIYFSPIEIGSNYDVWSTDYNTYSLVYSCLPIIPGFLKYETAWILSRTKNLNQTIIDNLKNLLGKQREYMKPFKKTILKIPKWML